MRMRQSLQVGRGAKRACTDNRKRGKEPVQVMSMSRRQDRTGQRRTQRRAHGMRAGERGDPVFFLLSAQMPRHCLLHHSSCVWPAFLHVSPPSPSATPQPLFSSLSFLSLSLFFPCLPVNTWSPLLLSSFFFSSFSCKRPARACGQCKVVHAANRW